MAIEFTYSLEDFDTTAPYEYICNVKDPFQQGVEERKLTEYAKSVGFKSFKSALRAYRASLKTAMSQSESTEITEFEHQGAELDTGTWTANDFGVYRTGAMGVTEWACAHPIMPVERLRNIDTGELKVRLAFRRGQARKAWTDILVDSDTVSNAKNIVSLARIGVSVTSGKKAQSLVDYLGDVMDLNYDTIPEVKSVSRMGWNPEGFTPYVDGICFDGNDNFARTFNSIKPHGNLVKWMDEATSARQHSITARMLLAASFASVLIEPLGTLPFFVHLWGMDSGTGKSVGQMLAVSVWADPTIGGDYFKTFRSTSVGLEVMAGFLNSLPLVIDELQLAKDARGKLIFNVYELAAGSGKTRSTKTLGLAASTRWANCIITSGESPIVGDQDGAGVANRVIEVECTADNKVIEDGHRTANTVKVNYGYAGQEFIRCLTQPGEMDRAKALYEKYYEQCTKGDTTSKQAMAAAIILVGDHLATEWIFMDGNALTVEEIGEFLKSSDAVSASQRGYDYMCGWVSVNATKFSQDPQGDIYGVIEDTTAYIIRPVWNDACEKAGISARALLSHLKTKGLIETSGKGYTKSKRIGGLPTNCVVMKLPGSYEIDGNDDDFPEQWLNV